MYLPRKLPPRHILREQFSYDPDTGVFTRLRQNTRWTRVGEPAGHRCATHGYRFLHVIGYGSYRAHRVAWKMYYGVEPPEIDHKNRDRSDNRIRNLRAATRASNMLNKNTYLNNKSGFRGVCQKKSNGKWIAQITHKSRPIYLGIFDTPEEASAVYESARVKLTGTPSPQ